MLNLKRLKSLFSKKSHASTTEAIGDPVVYNALLKRVGLLERNYLVLLKRVLEMDGIQLVESKVNSLNSKVLQTPSDEHNKAHHDREPTIH